MRPHSPVKAQIDGLERYLRLEPRSRVLDLGCASGKRTIELARRGHRVLGLEPDPKALSEARESAAGETLNLHFHKADPRAISYRAEFDAVVLLGGALGRFPSDRDALRCLEAARKALKPQGLLLVDAINREWLMRHFEPNLWEQEEGEKAVVLDDAEFDFETGRLVNRKTLVGPDGKRTPALDSRRVYALTELKELLSRAGFDYRQSWGGFDGSAYGLDSPRLVTLAAPGREPRGRVKADDGLPKAIRIKGRR
jgi:SAM-dependent methyltransferase